MTKSTVETLRGVSETLLVTLYLRAIESQRPDALIKDKKAVALVKQLRDEGQYDFSRIRLLHLNEANKLVTILRSREFDRYTRDFLMRHPNALVVHIGCGFDTRFDRVDNGQVVWYDLDLPDIIELRRQLIGDEEERYHLLGYSVLDSTWLEVVSEYRQRPFLFLAEGLTMHLKETQNKALVRMLYDHFPGAELIFDAYSPIHNIVSNLQSARFGFRTHWGLWHGQEIESWGNVSPSGAGIRLLDEWGFLDRTETRLTRLRWLRPIESLFRTLRIYHFKLGE
jgi:O-methyltransferase involved in polyketide biosynthesis